MQSREQLLLVLLALAAARAFETRQPPMPAGNVASAAPPASTRLLGRGNSVRVASRRATFVTSRAD